MGEEKRPFTLRIRGDLYTAIERQAEKEGRSPSNLGENLIEWAFEQLQTVQDSIQLKYWEARPTKRAIDNHEALGRAIETDKQAAAKVRPVKLGHRYAKSLQK